MTTKKSELRAKIEGWESVVRESKDITDNSLSSVANAYESMADAMSQEDDRKADEYRLKASEYKLMRDLIINADLNLLIQLDVLNGFLDIMGEPTSTTSETQQQH